MNNFIIYALLDNSGIRYIGVTSHTLEKRLKEHLREKSSKNSYKINWIKKYKNEVKISLLFEGLTEEEAYKKEIELIKIYRENGFDLVNQSSGGEHSSSGVKRSDATKEKLSNLRKGKKTSTETKQKISNSCKGKNLGNKGRTGQPHKKETIEKMKLASSSKRKKVFQFSINDKFLKEFESMSEASRQTNVAVSSICSCISGHPYYKTAGGFKWKLTKD